MNYEDFEDENDSVEDYSAAGDSQLRNGLKNSMALNRSHEAKKGEENPYSNDILKKFIDHLGFPSDEVPRFTEMAKKLNTTIKHEPVKKDLTSMDNHDMIEDISPSKRNDDLDIRKQALKRLIAKYKG